jgi:hypothetical protein
MTLHRAIVTLAVGALGLVLACVPEPTHKKLDGGIATPGGSGGSGGSAGSGGSGGSGGAGGSGGSGGYGGEGGSGGSGGTAGTGGSGGSGGSGRADGSAGSGGSKADGGGGDASAINLQTIEDNVLANCVFCHPGMDGKRTDFDPNSKGIYERMTTTDPLVAATCPLKVLIVPGKPDMSLMYLKLTGKMPAGCGMRMPLAANMKMPGTPLGDRELGLLRMWIMNGAPMK